MKLTASCLFVICLHFFNTHLSAQNVGIGTTTPQAKLAVGSTSQFRVDANGNLIRINNVPVNYPAAQGANGQSLTNDGAGNLSWNYPAVKNSIVLVQAADTTSLKQQGFSVLKKYENESDTLLDSLTEVLSGSWQFNLNLNSGTFETSQETPTNGTNLYTYGADSSVYEYNTTTNLYSQLPNKSPLHFRQLPSITIVNNEMYVFGGYTNLGTLEIPDFQFFNDGAKYNLTTHVWTAMTTGLIKIGYQATVVLGNNIYYIGGVDSVGNFLYVAHPTPVLKYNTVTKVWSDETPPGENNFTILQGSAATNGSNIYILPFGKDSVYEFQTGAGNFVRTVKYSATNPEYLNNTVLAYGNSSLYAIDSYFDSLDVTPGIRKYRIYKINPATGQTTDMNHCGTDAFGLYQYSLTYNAGANVFYYVINNTVNKFSPVATTSVCKTFYNKRHFWYYMKKS